MLYTSAIVASSVDSPEMGSEEVPGLMVEDVAEDDPESAVVLEAGVGGLVKLLWSQTSCSGVNGGVVLITETARMRSEKVDDEVHETNGI